MKKIWQILVCKRLWIFPPRYKRRLLPKYCKLKKSRAIFQSWEKKRDRESSFNSWKNEKWWKLFCWKFIYKKVNNNCGVFEDMETASLRENKRCWHSRAGFSFAYFRLTRGRGNGEKLPMGSEKCKHCNCCLALFLFHPFSRRFLNCTFVKHHNVDVLLRLFYPPKP